MTPRECVRAVQRHLARERRQALANVATAREAWQAGDVGLSFVEYQEGRVDGLTRALTAVLAVEFDD